jgi:flagellar biosynthesis chaperone FliJ
LTVIVIGYVIMGLGILSKLLDLKEQFEQLQNKYQEYPPKVDAYEHLNHKRAHNYYLCEEQIERQRSSIEKSAT